MRLWELRASPRVGQSNVEARRPRRMGVMNRSEVRADAAGRAIECRRRTNILCDESFLVVEVQSWKPTLGFSFLSSVPRGC
jgi:hypothetical protein